jgi:hypothetical protein
VYAHGALVHAGPYVTALQKARVNAACRPLHPDVVAIIGEGLKEFGLLPANGKAAGGASPALPALGRA